MATDRFTLFGLSVALLGWIVLIADFVISPFLMRTGNMASIVALRSDVFSLAETTIFSGFALAILGVLRAGFGVLHRFFGSVLERANAPKPGVAASQPLHADTPSIAPAVEHAVLRPSEVRPARARNYVILANGAVEVETLLGTRVFASLDEARDYIR